MSGDLFEVEMSQLDPHPNPGRWWWVGDRNSYKTACLAKSTSLKKEMDFHAFFFFPTVLVSLKVERETAEVIR